MELKRAIKIRICVFTYSSFFESKLPSRNQTQVGAVAVTSPSRALFWNSRIVLCRKKQFGRHKRRQRIYQKVAEQQPYLLLNRGLSFVNMKGEIAATLEIGHPYGGSRRSHVC